MQLNIELIFRRISDKNVLDRWNYRYLDLIFIQMYFIIENKNN